MEVDDHEDMQIALSRKQKRVKLEEESKETSSESPVLEQLPLENMQDTGFPEGFDTISPATLSQDYEIWPKQIWIGDPVNVSTITTEAVSGIGLTIPTISSHTSLYNTPPHLRVNKKVYQKSQSTCLGSPDGPL